MSVSKSTGPFSLADEVIQVHLGLCKPHYIPVYAKCPMDGKFEDERRTKDLGASLTTAAGAAAIKLETGLYPRHASGLTAP
jgi:hypothetical protein